MGTLTKIPITDKWVDFTTGIIALLALLISALSYRIAKRSLKLSQLQYNDKLPNFSLEFKKAYRRILLRHSNRKILFFHCTISNKSENKNTFKASLEIQYRLEGKQISKIVLEHDPGIQKLLSASEISVFPLNISLNEKEEKSGWFLYEQPMEAYSRVPIYQYKMNITDINSKMASVYTSIINENPE